MSTLPASLAVSTLPGGSVAWPQRAIARLVGSRLFWSLFIAMGFTLPLVRSVLRPLPVPPPTLAAFPAFKLVDEAGRPLTNQALAGRLVIAEFAAPGAVLAGSPLARLQTRVKNTGNAVHLLTFVKGNGDPASLAELALKAHAGTWRWSFATGAVDELETAAASVLKTPSLEGKLLLVDAHGNVRRVTSPAKEEVDAMMRDIQLLANLEKAPSSAILQGLDSAPQEKASR